MRWLVARRGWLSAVGVGVLAAGGRAFDPPRPAPSSPSGGVVQAQGRDQPLGSTAPPVAPTGDAPTATPAAPPPLSPIADGPANPQSLGAPTTGRQPEAPAGNPTTSVPLAADQAAPVLNATNLGQFLNRSAASTGVLSQQRNALVTDPRIRGLQSRQYNLYGDNGFYFPVRLDLDTPVTRFDPGAVRDVVLVKGPYSVLYGPALAFFDVATLDSPRSDGFEFHGRTALNYQTNGERWNGLQSVWASDDRWGVRVTYNGLQGSDYRDGSGQLVPSSYLSHNVNWAFGFDPTPESRVEFKGLRVHQQGVEFPGLYFDVNEQDTEAYTGRLTVDGQGAVERVVFDVFYNTTVGTGTTAGSAKQAFVRKLLAVSFNPDFFPATPNAFSSRFGLSPASSVAQAQAAADAIGAGPLRQFRDFSTSEFANRSVGYRLFADWGSKETVQLTTGTDLRVLGQNLQENILFQQLSGRNLNTGEPVAPPAFPLFGQNQSIPPSNSVNPGLFAALEAHLTDRFTARAGGRMDWVRSSTSDRTIRGNVDLFGPPGSGGGGRFVVDPSVYSALPGDPETTRDFYLLAGYLQGEYKLADGLTGVLSVGHGERAPTLTELYAAGPFVGVLQQGTSRLIGDPHLSPEKLTQIDLGLRADYDWFQGGVNGFYGWVQDYITFDQINRGPGLTQVVFTNTDLATLAGAEAFAQVDLTTWLSGFGTLSYVQGVDQTHADRRRRADLASSRRTNPGTGAFAAQTEPLPQIPPLDSRVGIRVHQPTRERRWQVEFSANVVAGQNAVARSLGEFPTPGFTVFTVRTYWQATDRLLLTAGVENFGDKLYRFHLDPISGNILNVDPLFRPGTNFYFGTQYTF